MKKTLATFLAFVMLLGTMTNVFAANGEFTDVKASDWFYNDVKTAFELGLISGRTDTTYAPEENLTYAEAIKLAACMHQLYTKGAISLTNGDPWYMPYVEYCGKNRIITKEYVYSNNVTRAGYMQIFANALPNEGLEAINNVPDNSIPDVPLTESYAEGVYKLYRAGILQGVDAEHRCSPTSNIRRCEVATILARMMNKDKRIKFSMDKNAPTPETPVIPENPAPGETTVPETNNTPEVNEPSTPTVDEKPEVIEPSTPVVSEDPVTEGDTTPTVSENPSTEDASVLKFTKDPIGGTVDVGVTISTTVTVTGGTTPYTYKWMYNDGSGWKAISASLGTVSGVTSEKVSVKANSAASYKVHCVVTDANGNEATSKDTDFIFKAKENTKFRIEKQPESVTSPSDIPISVNVKVAGGTEPYAYTWACDTGDKWIALDDVGGIVGSRTDTLYVIDSNPTSFKTRCYIEDATGKTIISDTIDIVVTAPAKNNNEVETEKPSGSAEALKITKQPVKTNVGLGETAVLTVDVTGGTPGYTYQWFYQVGTGFQKFIEGPGVEGTTTNKLSITTSNPSKLNVMCQIKDSAGKSVTTNRVELLIEYISTATQTAKLEIETQPSDTTVTVGTDAVLKVKAKNGAGNYTYQWQMSTGKDSWIRISDNDMISGTTTDTLTLKSKAASNITVRCVVKDSAGDYVNSNGVKVTFN